MNNKAYFAAKYTKNLSNNLRKWCPEIFEINKNPGLLHKVSFLVLLSALDAPGLPRFREPKKKRFMQIHSYATKKHEH